MSIKAMEMALEALEVRCGTNADERKSGGVIEALRTAIQQATQPAEVTDAELLDAYNSIDPCNESPQDRLIRRLRAILALRPVQSTFCEYCGGNDEEPVDHCMDCARPVQVPMTCHCQTCRPITITDMRMVLCPKCGNKRCPHANDHRNDCTGSNEPGQPGSAYPAHQGITAQAKKEQA